MLKLNLRKKGETKEYKAKEKFSYVKFYEEKKPIKSLLSKIRGGITLLVFMVCSYYLCQYQIGDGAYKYSEQTYKNIATAIEGCVTNETGVDTKNLRENEAYKGFVDKYYNYFENGETVLKCVKEDGYFVAIVTLKFDENYAVIGEPERNFNSLEEYMQHYKNEVAIRTFGIGGGVWLIFELLFSGLAKLMYEVCKWRTRRKVTNSTFEEESDAV